MIEEEAARQAREVEKTRYRYNELMTLGYMQAAEWLENAASSSLRAQDVLKIIGLHMDAVKAFEVDRQHEAEDDWTEEDDEEFAELIDEIDEIEDFKENSEEDSGEENSESDDLDETE